MTEWDKLTWEDIRDFCSNNESVVFLPVGSTEQHGPHLPVGLDYIIADHISHEAVSRLKEQGIKALKLPAVPYGLSVMWASYPGTITITTETFIGLIKDVISSVISAGCRNIIIVNGHAGNSDGLRVAARDIVEEIKDGSVAVVTLWELCGDMINELFETKFFHADEVETSIALALGLKIREIPQNPQAPHRRYSEKWHSLDLEKRPKAYVYRPESITMHGDGAFGSPWLATSEKGRKLLDCMIFRLTDLAVDLIKGNV